MKKIKWYLIATAFIGIASAFATRPVQTAKYGKRSLNVFVKLDATKENQPGAGGWTCNNVSDTCLFTPVSGINQADPIGTTYPRSQMAGPASGAIGHKLVEN